MACGSNRDAANATNFKPDLESLILPMDAYHVDARDDHLMAKASNLIIEQCMRDKGFSWQPLPLGTPSQKPLNDRRYGIRSKTDARQFGFARAPDPYEEAQVAAQAALQTELTDAEKQAYYGGDGDGRGGCVAKSARALNGGEVVDDSLLQSLAGEAYETARSSDEVSTANDRWLECMQPKGYSGSSTVNEFETDARWSESEEATAEETQAAVADAVCKEQADYVAAFYEVEWREQLRLIEDQAEAFDEYKDKLDRLLERAADIIEKG